MSRVSSLTVSSSTLYFFSNPPRRSSIPPSTRGLPPRNFPCPFRADHAAFASHFCTCTPVLCSCSSSAASSQLNLCLVSMQTTSPESSPVVLTNRHSLLSPPPPPPPASPKTNPSPPSHCPLPFILFVVLGPSGNAYIGVLIKSLSRCGIARHFPCRT